jgi:hypothetical protein
MSERSLLVLTLLLVTFLVRRSGIRQNHTLATEALPAPEAEYSAPEGKGYGYP